MSCSTLHLLLLSHTLQLRFPVPSHIYCAPVTFADGFQSGTSLPRVAGCPSEQYYKPSHFPHPLPVTVMSFGMHTVPHIIVLIYLLLQPMEWTVFTALHSQLGWINCSTLYATVMYMNTTSLHINIHNLCLFYLPTCECMAVSTVHDPVPPAFLRFS